MTATARVRLPVRLLLAVVVLGLGGFLGPSVVEAGVSGSPHASSSYDGVFTDALSPGAVEAKPSSMHCLTERRSSPTTPTLDAQVVATEAESGAMSCSVNSFTGDTLVVRGDGNLVAISTLEVGDTVLATDPDTGRTVAEPIDKVIVHGGEHTMVDVRFADGSKITATDHHPFWDASQQRFVYAIDLKAGDMVRRLDGTLPAASGTMVYREVVTAYNLTVRGIHTYYAGATPVLVHNSCGDLSPAEATNTAGLADDAAGSYGPFHRLESPTQTPGTAALQEANGEMWGATARGGLNPTVKAYQGPLPPGARGVEFTTPVRPSAVGLGRPGDIAIWRRGSPGVVDVDDDFVEIACTVVRNTQC